VVSNDRVVGDVAWTARSEGILAPLVESADPADADTLADLRTAGLLDER
jgi:hypothetical protein